MGMEHRILVRRVKIDFLLSRDKCICMYRSINIHDMIDNLLKVLYFQQRRYGCEDGHFREKSYSLTYANKLS